MCWVLLPFVLFRDNVLKCACNVNTCMLLCRCVSYVCSCRLCSHDLLRAFENIVPKYVSVRPVCSDWFITFVLRCAYVVVFLLTSKVVGIVFIGV